MSASGQTLIGFARQVTAALDERITAVSFWTAEEGDVFVVAVEAKLEGGGLVGTRHAAGRPAAPLPYDFGAAVAERINRELFPSEPGGTS